MFSKNLARVSGLGTFGSARWMDKWEFNEANLSEKTGAPRVGAVVHDPVFQRDAYPVYLNSDTHYITVAPTRTGKGTCHIVPNLLEMKEHSIFVLDVKSENHGLTANYRENVLNHKVFRFAPFDPAITNSWNPIAAIRVQEDDPDRICLEQENADYLVSLLLSPPSVNADPFWHDASSRIVKAFIMYVAYSPYFGDGFKQPEYPQERSMAEVLRLLSLPQEQFNYVLKVMGTESQNPFLRQLAREVKRMTVSEKQLSTILSQVFNEISVWGSERVKRVTTEHDFDFSSFREELSTFYLMVDPDMLERYKPVIRAIVGLAIRDLRLSYCDSEHRGKPVYFFLDEFPCLGRMEPILKGISYLAGYGIRLWMFIQNISQVKQHYGQEWETFFANCGVKMFFGVTDIDTAELVSRMSGQTTVQNVQHSFSKQESSQSSSSTSHSKGSGSSGSSTNTSSSTSSSSGSSYGVSLSSVGRALLTPDEILRLSRTEEIIFFQGYSPIKALKLPYYESDKHLERVGTWELPAAN